MIKKVMILISMLLALNYVLAYGGGSFGIIGFAPKSLVENTQIEHIIKEIPKVYKNRINHIVINKTNVNNISFELNKNYKRVYVAVKKHKNIAPILIKKIKVLNSFDVSLNVHSEDIKKVQITFKLPLEQVRRYFFELWHNHKGNWTKLNYEEVNRDSEYVYYKTIVNKLSTFSVVATDYKVRPGIETTTTQTTTTTTLKEIAEPVIITSTSLTTTTTIDKKETPKQTRSINNKYMIYAVSVLVLFILGYIYMIYIK